MGNIVVGASFIIILNVLMMFVGFAIADINPAAPICYHVSGSILEGLNNSMQSDILTQVPGTEGAAVTAGSTSVFTDIFVNVRSFFRGVGIGLSFLTGIVAAPVNVFGCMNLPVILIAGLSLLWYGVMFLIFIAFLWGRDG